jgi:hypothetical protein
LKKYNKSEVEVFILFKKELEKSLADYETLKDEERKFKQICDEKDLKILDLDEKLKTRIQM